MFTDDYKEQPYWWEDAPRPVMDAAAPPARAEVLIIGSGYTGLCAAIQTARGGRHTVVLDAADAGYGCSSRNGGHISTSLKPGYRELAARYGAARALGILREGHNALAWVERFIRDEGIDCAFARVGRFFGAHTAGQYRRLAERLANPVAGLEIDAYMVPRERQRDEIGSDVYFGGAVFRNYASLHPARYHQGLLERALAAGVTVIPHCAVTGVVRNGGGFRISAVRTAETTHHTLQVRDVVVATSGYTGRATPWLRRRLIPIASSIIATEPLAPERVQQLLPNNRIVTDTRKMVYYYRASPDRRRILFGGRTHAKRAPPGAIALRLHAEMVRLFPELAATRISHSWTGYIGYTFDHMPHLGRHDGIYYSMGYCGSGVSLASYCGARIGQQLLGLAEGGTALDGLRFRTRPFYNGNPWFLAPMILYYRWHDRRMW